MSKSKVGLSLDERTDNSAVCNSRELTGPFTFSVIVSLIVSLQRWMYSNSLTRLLSNLQNPGPVVAMLEAIVKVMGL